MVSNNGLISRYESNRLIFKEIEKIDGNGNISKGVGWNFGDINTPFGKIYNKKGATKAFEDGIFNQSIARDKQAINDFNKMVNEQNMTVTEAASRMTQASDAARNYCAGLESGTADAEKFAADQEKIRKATQKTQKGFKGVSSSTKAMFGNIGAMLLLDIAFKAAGWAWDTLNDKFKITPEKKIEAMETAINKYNDAISQSSENTKTIKSLKDEFNQLAKGVDESGKNISLSAEEYSRYNEIANQLASISPSIIQGYTAEGNAILDRNSAIEEGIRAQEEYAAAATRAYTSNSTGDDIIKGSTENLKSSLKDSREDLVNIGKAFDDLHSYAIASNNYGAAGKDKASGIISDYFGREVNLSQASLDDLERIDTEWNSIIQNAKQSGYSEEIIANAQAEYGALHSSIANIQDAYQPIYQWLSTVVSQADATGKSISEAIPEGMQAGFQAGLKNIAMSGKSASEMRIDATNLANQLSASYRANDGRKYFQTQKEYDEYLLELKRDIADAQKDIYKDQQDDLETLLDLVEDMLRQEADDYIEVLRKQKDTFNDLIDKKKEMLQLAEDELALQEELEDGNRQMADIQNQIAILSRDDSRAAKAKIAELQKELADLQRDQNKTIRDETLSKTEDALDKQAEIFEKIIDKQIEVVENWLNNKSAVIEVVADTIAQKETNNLLERLISYNGEHGDALLSTVDKAWKDISTLTKEYGTDINKIVEALQKGIDVNITGGLISSDQTDYAKTQAETKNTPTHHAGIAAGFTGNGADLKQHEVYRLLTDDELVFNREDQMRIASQLQVLDTIKSSYSNLAKNIDSQSVAAMPRAVELTVNAPVTIEGNASPDTIKQLEEFGNSIADATLTKLNDALRVNGVHSRAASNMRKN